MNITEITDDKLLNLCSYWGRQTLFARNKFTALLPEVYRRKLYEKKGFNSIFEFAFRLAGLSEAQVKSAVRIEGRLAPDSEVRELFMSGKVSVSKIEKVITVLNTQNDHEVAQILLHAPRSAAEAYAKDVKSFPGKNVQQEIEIIDEPPLSNEVKKKLNELARKKIDINQFILEALQKREHEIAEEKEVQAEKAEQKMIEQCVEGKTISRHVPAETKKLMKKEFGEKCAISTCNNKAVVIHHTNRFSISRDHNPYYLAQLCDPHHKIAHTVDAKAMAKRQKHVT